LNKRVTIVTIAKKLNVSTTTVYRALNNKPRISEDTKKEILKLTAKLGFKPNALARTLPRKRIRIAVLVSAGFSDFTRYVVKGVQETEKELHDYGVIVDYYSCMHERHRSIEDIEEYRKTMEHISSLNYNGVLVEGFEDDEAFKRLEEKNIPIALVVTDIKNLKRKFCVQYDGFTAGRMAAELLFWNVGKNGKVVLANGFDDVPLHKQIEKGFLDQAASLSLKVIKVLYNQDNNDIACKNTNKLLKDHPDLDGIYICTFASSGVIKSVVKSGKAGRICLITSDINDEIRESLENGIVKASIFQDQFRQGRYGLRYLYDYITSNQKINDVIYINPQIILKSNMELFDG
jgi:LacI family transcriptional regulator